MIIKMYSFVFKAVGYLFLVSIILGFIAHRFVDGCYDGALSYGGCVYNGKDVSELMTSLGWINMGLLFFWFFLAFVGLALFIIEKTIEKFKHNKSLKQDK